MLNITDVRIRFTSKEDSTLKAIANITIDDCFAIHDIKVLEGSKGLYIRMPSRKTPEGEFKDIAHPTNNETRDALATTILSKYETEKANRVIKVEN